MVTALPAEFVCRGFYLATDGSARQIKNPQAAGRGVRAIMQNSCRHFDMSRNCGAAQTEKKGRRQKKPSPSHSRIIADILKINEAARETSMLKMLRP
jgi:hypothetical protein